MEYTLYHEHHLTENEARKRNICLQNIKDFAGNMGLGESDYTLEEKTNVDGCGHFIGTVTNEEWQHPYEAENKCRVFLIGYEYDVDSPAESA